MGAPRFVMDDFWPSDLFLGGIPGAWYDPTDLSTMFQDSTGTTPVTAVEQPVGLVLDKSQGLALGPDLITNGGPFVNTTGWTAIAGATLSVDSGRLKVAQGLTDYVSASQAISTVVGRTYRVTYDLVSDGTSSPSFVVYARQGAGSSNIAFSTTGFGTGKTLYFTAVGTTTYIEPGSATSADNIYGLFNNIRVELVAGNHASQSTAASRPTYRARYNLLTQSEDFSQAVWVKFGGGTGVAPVVTTNAAIAPDGTLTADSIAFNRGAGNLIADQSTMYQAPTVVGGSHTQTIWLKAATAGDVGKQLALRNVAGSSYGAVTLTADWVRYSRVETGSAANFEIACRGTITTGNTVTALVWGAQLLTAADVTATGNAYQRIAAATVYDTAPIFRPYLAFDGVDDSLATAAAVNLTSTRQASVFVGQTKLSDAAGGVILGHGVDFSTVGAFEYQSNTAVNATTAFRGRSTAGSAAQAGFTKDVTSPGTFVFTSLVDYTAAAGSEFAGRYNTVAQAQNIGVAEENTGTFGNNVLTIGARQGGASQRFNGRIYELIVRGAASSTTEIIDTETWVNQRTGGY